MPLKKLTEQVPKEHQSVSDLIRSRYSEIQQARDNGWPWQKIAEELRDEGFEIKKETIAQTFRRLRRKQRKEEGEK